MDSRRALLTEETIHPPSKRDCLENQNRPYSDGSRASRSEPTTSLWPSLALPETTFNEPFTYFPDSLRETIRKIALRVWITCFWWPKAAIRSLLASF